MEMIDGLNDALLAYGQRWRRLLAERKNKEFFQSLRPTAVGWKVEDRTEYDKLVAELHDQADYIVEVWMHKRWIAKVHLKDVQLTNGVEIIKLMQRRPESTDAVGLDHLDFYADTELAWNKEVIAAEPSLTWSKESNDMADGYDWLSIWFDGTEAKIKSYTVLDILQTELKISNQRILGV